MMRPFHIFFFRVYLSCIVLYLFEINPKSFIPSNLHYYSFFVVVCLRSVFISAYLNLFPHFLYIIVIFTTSSFYMLFRHRMSYLRRVPAYYLWNIKILASLFCCNHIKTNAQCLNACSISFERVIICSTVITGVFLFFCWI